jgi:hypothetical protein
MEIDNSIRALGSTYQLPVKIRVGCGRAIAQDYDSEQWDESRTIARNGNENTRRVKKSRLRTSLL